jgi:hypothetical protein
MKADYLAAYRRKQHNRMAGTIDQVIRLSFDDGSNGLALFGHEWDKRDVMREFLAVEPQIAEQAKTHLDGIEHDGPSVFFNTNCQTTGPLSTLEEAREKATTVIYENN